MRYGIVRASTEVLKLWADRNYRGLMLAFMAIELLLLIALVIVEVMDYIRK